MNIKIIILTITLLSFISTASADNPISDFKTIIPIPDNIVAGSTYQSEYTFIVIHQTTVFINFTIEHPDVNYDDWYIYYILNKNIITPNETSPGTFSSDELTLLAGDFNLTLYIQPIPNVNYSEYNYDLSLNPVNIPIPPTPSTPDDDSFGGFGGRRRFLSTPTPTPNATEMSTIKSADTTVKPTLMVTPTATQTEDQDEVGYMYVITVLCKIIVGFVIILILILIIIKLINRYRFRNDED